MRAAAENPFQLFGVPEKGQGLKAMIGKPEKGADADIIDSRLHRPVHDKETVGIVGFRAGAMILSVKLCIVGFLKTNIGADVACFQLPKLGGGQRRDLDVYSPNSLAVFLDPVDGCQGLL